MLLSLAGCAGSRNVAYFKNIDEVNLQNSVGLYDAKIMPKDMLTITVITSTEEVSKPFNLSVGQTLSVGGVSSGTNGLQGYLVDNNGNIDFPVIGRLHVAGLTKSQCEKLIRERVAPYFSETERPVVTVRMASYRVTVIGEVGSPGVVPVSTEKMSVLEALASAGDLTIYGKRDNIMLIREDSKGEKSVHRLNLNDAEFFNSPYYYLQQNDVIYVEPNSVKAKSSYVGATTSIWISLIGVVTSVSSLLFNVLR